MGEKARRSWKLFWYTLPAVVVFLVVGVGLLVLWQWNLAAARDYEAKSFREAQVSYKHQGTLTGLFPEPWKAIYNEGTAHLAGSDYQEASEVLKRALEVVPKSPPRGAAALKDPKSGECLVRINLALALEGLGDKEMEAKNLDQAIGYYDQAMQTVGPCSSNGASEHDQTSRPQAQQGSRPDTDEQRQWDKKQVSKQQKEQESSSPSTSSSGSTSEPPSKEPRTPDKWEEKASELGNVNKSARSDRPSKGTGFGGGQNW